MISATYFGEITELNSRAVWYSDEEDDDDDDDDADETGLDCRRKSPSLALAKPLNHDTMRESISLTFKRVSTNQQLKFNTCLISQASSAQYKHFKLNDSHLLGHFDSFGKAYAYPAQKGQPGGGAGNNSMPIEEASASDEEYLLWLLFDSTNQYISGQEVGYFVETLRESLQDEFNLASSCQLIILSNQYSTSEHLEYLNNFGHTSTASMKLEQPPFNGRPLLPPSLIRNQFESALFEQFTLSLRPAFVVCLPNPKNFWFDKTKSWPSIPDQIIDHKLNDDSLEKTLIFT